MIQYVDEVVWTWYDNRVEDIPELDKAIGEVMGEDDGENFDFNSNLDQ